MQLNIRQVEKRLQTLIESLSLVFPVKNPVELLVHQLVTCIQENLSTNSTGGLIAPSRFEIIFSSPKMIGQVKTAKSQLAISTALEQVGLENGFAFEHSPVFEMKINPSISPKKIIVDCLPEPQDLNETGIVFSAESRQNVSAFLIMADGTIFEMRKNIINIGRGQENDLIINKPQVSRSHAQIRNSRGEFMIFDLNSTGGSFINGQKITRRLLCSGDVISLAGFNLIFNEDSNSIAQTSPINVDDRNPKDSKGKKLK